MMEMTDLLTQGAAGTGGGGLLVVAHKFFADRRLRELELKISQIEIDAAKSYATKDDMKATVEAISKGLDVINSKLDRLNDKLDTKADK